jgi:uncharacterized protein DUF6790
MCFSQSNPRPASAGRTAPFTSKSVLANLGIGLASLYAAFSGFEARLSASLAAASFLIGAGLIHIKEIMASGNLTPGNAGPILVTDFLTPLAVLTLFFLTREVLQSKSPTTLALEAELEVARKAMREHRNALSELGK